LTSQRLKSKLGLANKPRGDINMANIETLKQQAIRRYDSKLNEAFKCGAMDTYYNFKSALDQELREIEIEEGVI
jgi:hypothetical protein